MYRLLLYITLQSIEENFMSFNLPVLLLLSRGSRLKMELVDVEGTEIRLKGWASENIL